MAYLVGLPLLALLAMLQSAVFAHLRLLDGRPDLVLLAVVGWGLAGRGTEAMIWGLCGGLLLDLLSGAPFGISAISLVLTAYLLSLLEGRLWGMHPLLPPAAALLGTALLHGLGLASLLLTGRALDLAAAATRVILPSAFLNVALSLPAAQLAGSLRQALFPEKVTL